MDSPRPRRPTLGEAAKADVDVKVLSVRFPESHARLHSGRFTVKQTLTLEWGPADVTVEENGSAAFNKHGDMAVELKTGPTESMQRVYANEVIYLRNRGGAWRASRDPTDERRFWADQTFSALRSILDSFKGRLVLTPQGQETVGTRKATRFGVSLAGQAAEPDVLGEKPESPL